MPVIEISGRKVGSGYRPLIIAELGINHGGDLDVAKKMVMEAVKAGAEVIKHQTHVVWDEMSSEAKLEVPDHTDESIYSIIERCSLSESDERALMDYVISLGAIFISTPFSRAAADRLESFGVPAYKIGSGECNNYPLIEHIASFGKPIILSTGMNGFEAIERAVEIIRRRRCQFALLHCTNVYPTPPELVRLDALVDLEHKFSDAVVGLSDHTTTNYTCFGAVALGASILEKHFTDSKNRIGPDIVCSVDPLQLEDLVKGCNTIYSARGSYKGPVPEEESIMSFAFASVVATRDIKIGEPFDAENLWVRRPGGGGYSAAEYDGLLGRVATRNIAKDEQLKTGDAAE